MHLFDIVIDNAKSINKHLRISLVAFIKMKCTERSLFRGRSIDTSDKMLLGMKPSSFYLLTRISVFDTDAHSRGTLSNWLNLTIVIKGM